MPWRKRQIRRTTRRTERRHATPKPPKPSIYKLQEEHPKFFDKDSRRFFSGDAGEHYAIKWNKEIGEWVLAVKTGSNERSGGRRMVYYKIKPGDLEHIDAEKLGW